MPLEYIIDDNNRFLKDINLSLNAFKLNPQFKHTFFISTGCELDFDLYDDDFDNIDFLFRITVQNNQGVTNIDLTTNKGPILGDDSSLNFSHNDSSIMSDFSYKDDAASKILEVLETTFQQADMLIADTLK